MCPRNSATCASTTAHTAASASSTPCTWVRKTHSRSRNRTPRSSSCCRTSCTAPTCERARSSLLRGTHPTAGAAQETQPAVGPHTVQFFDEQAVGTESARVDLPRFVPNVLPKPLRRGSHCVVSPHKSGLGQTRQRDTQRDTRLRRLWKTMSTASRHRPRSARQSFALGARPPPASRRQIACLTRALCPRAA